MKFYTALFVVLSGTWASAAETQVQSYSVKPAHRLVVADTPKGACLSLATKPPSCTSQITQQACCADPTATWYGDRPARI